MHLNWRKLLAVAVLSWSVLDMVGATIFLTRTETAGEHQFSVISSGPVSSGSSSESYCDGDCIFCSATIKQTPALRFIVMRVEIGRLEVPDTSQRNDGYLQPVYHPPQS